jgi:hypothetical protein
MQCLQRVVGSLSAKILRMQAKSESAGGEGRTYAQKLQRVGVEVAIARRE